MLKCMQGYNRPEEKCRWVVTNWLRCRPISCNACSCCSHLCWSWVFSCFRSFSSYTAKRTETVGLYKRKMSSCKLVRTQKGDPFFAWKLRSACGALQINQVIFCYRCSLYPSGTHKKPVSDIQTHLYEAVNKDLKNVFFVSGFFFLHICFTDSRL